MKTTLTYIWAVTLVVYFSACFVAWELPVDLGSWDPGDRFVLLYLWLAAAFVTFILRPVRT